MKPIDTGADKFRFGTSEGGPVVSPRPIRRWGRRDDSALFHPRLVAGLLGLVLAATANAQPAARPRAPTTSPSRTVLQIRSKHLILHTDLGHRRARRLLDGLELRLAVVSRYWARPIQQPIECFIVDDLARWERGSLPEERARLVLQRVGGFADRTVCGTVARARLFATSDKGVAQHELVHAYCLAACSAAGPDWYKEGMAEYFCRASRCNGGVEGTEEAIEFLRSAEQPATIAEIVEGQSFTAPITVSILRASETRRSLMGHAPVGWHDGDDRMLQKARQSYYWSWALCHFLARNSNYSDRFRSLGQAYVADSRPQFDTYFADCREQLEAEFGYFTQHLQRGYRVDLCRWNWNKKSKSPPSGQRTQARVRADRGLQSSGLLVTRGTRYDYGTEGHWQLSADGVSLTAAGQPDGAGQLVAAVLAPDGMSPSWQVRDSGSFVAPRSGTLYFRCQDQWHQLDDNRGRIRVDVQQAGPRPVAHAASNSVGS